MWLGMGDSEKNNGKKKSREQMEAGHMGFGKEFGFYSHCVENP